MNLETLKTYEPRNRFLYWIEEREKIRLKKARCSAKPWTDDEILSGYRFCNVRRMDDKVSAWLKNFWYDPYFNNYNMLPAVALARFINLPSSLRPITALVFETRWNPDKLVKTLRNQQEKGNQIFNGAYMVRGNDGTDKIDCVINHYVSNLFEDGRPLKLPTYSMRESHTLIQSKYGFGSFMAGQIVADLRWGMEGDWADAKEWAPVGPGSSRGLCRFFREKPKASLSQEEFNEGFQKVKKLVRNVLPSIYRRLEAIDIQNCLCEFDKYERTLWGEGRPKSKYPGA